MKVDLENADQISDFTTIPAGTYMCRVEEVRERQSRAGDTMWGIRLVVCEGEFTGKMAAWDNLVFSNRGLNRLRLILRSMGLPTEGQFDLSPDDLIDKRVFVEVRPAEYHSPEGGMTRRNEIPYEGYQSPVRDAAGADSPGSDPGSTGDRSGNGNDRVGGRVADDDLPF